jgi:hypothetical protein
MTSVSQVLVGLSRVGLVGLRQAIERADASGLEEREALVELMMNMLAERNYISPASTEAYRLALWREYLRHHGEDLRHLYSPIEVTVRARPGEQIDRLREILTVAFARHELRPVIAVETLDTQEPGPQLWIGDDLVVAGATDPERIAKRIARQISDW